MAAPQLWQIYKNDGSLLGPLTPMEVRDAIREGSVEAFDLVARVGSNVKQPVVEVDEIFVAADAAEAGKVDSIYEKNKEEFSNLEPTQTTGEPGSPNSLSRENIKTEVSVNNRKSEPINSRVSRIVKSGRLRAGPGKQAIRRYYVMDKSNNFFGPFSAIEIQGQFFRGQIQDGFSVAKDRGGKSVPIARFVSAYSGAKAKNYNSEQTNFNFSALHKIAKASKPLSIFGQPLQRSPSRRQSSRGKNTSSRTTVWLFVVAAFVAVCVYEYKRNPEFASLFRPQVDQLYDDPIPEPQQMPEPPAVQLEIAAPTDAAEVPMVIRPANKTSKVDKATAKKNAKQKKKKNREPPRVAPRTSYRAPMQITSAPPLPKVNNPYSRSAGTVIRISDFSYNVGQLNNCGLKCKLNGTDASGQPVQLVFFKAQFQNELAKRNGRAAARGRIDLQGGKTIMYLQSVE